MKEIKCALCSKLMRHHKANTLNCPFGKKTRAGYTNYMEKVFKAEVKIPNKKKKATFADECLEIAEKATPGPWEFERIAFDGGDFCFERNDDSGMIQIYEHNYEKPMKAKFDAQFIAAARTMVPELAKRLNKAIKHIKSMGALYDLIVRKGDQLKLIDELEAPMEGET